MTLHATIDRVTDRIRARGHDRLPTFGVGRDLPRAEWQAIVRQMLGCDLIRPDPERHGGLAITAAAHAVRSGDSHGPGSSVSLSESDRT